MNTHIGKKKDGTLEYTCHWLGVAVSGAGGAMCERGNSRFQDGVKYNLDRAAQAILLAGRSLLAAAEKEGISSHHLKMLNSLLVIDTKQ